MVISFTDINHVAIIGFCHDNDNFEAVAKMFVVAKIRSEPFQCISVCLLYIIYI